MGATASQRRRAARYAAGAARRCAALHHTLHDACPCDHLLPRQPRRQWLAEGASCIVTLRVHQAGCMRCWGWPWSQHMAGHNATLARSPHYCAQAKPRQTRQVPRHSWPQCLNAAEHERRADLAGLQRIAAPWGRCVRQCLAPNQARTLADAVQLQERTATPGRHVGRPGATIQEWAQQCKFALQGEGVGKLRM